MEELRNHIEEKRILSEKIQDADIEDNLISDIQKLQEKIYLSKQENSKNSDVNQKDSIIYINNVNSITITFQK